MYRGLLTLHPCSSMNIPDRIYLKAFPLYVRDHVIYYILDVYHIDQFSIEVIYN
jgi:hypothetical protein